METASTETNIPEANPSNMAANVLAVSSYIITLVICRLVQPIDLNTPNSHIESLMLADIVIISWNVPSMKTTVLHIQLKNYRSFMYSF